MSVPGVALAAFSPPPSRPGPRDGTSSADDGDVSVSSDGDADDYSESMLLAPYSPPLAAPSTPNASHSISEATDIIDIGGGGGGGPFVPTATPVVPQKRKRLKPLREVLLKLIGNLKKRDAYGFFLEPVNTALVPGYKDVIKHPMDFGTMKRKVEKSWYRTLDEFKDDLLLVTTNARTFNPPSTIYHTEAARLEAWGLGAIERERDSVDETAVPPPEFEAEPDLHLGRTRSRTSAASASPAAASARAKLNLRPTAGGAGGGEPAPEADKPKRISLPHVWGEYSEDEEPPPAPTPREERSVSPVTPLRPEGVSRVLGKGKQALGPGTGGGSGKTWQPGQESPFAKRPKLQKKKLTKREQEILEKEPHPKNADGSICAAELDNPWNLIPPSWPYDTPYLYPITRPPSATLRPLATPSHTKLRFPPSAPPSSVSSKPSKPPSTPASKPSSTSPSPSPAPDEDDAEAEAAADGARFAGPLDYGVFPTLPSHLVSSSSRKASDELSLYAASDQSVRTATREHLQAALRPFPPLSDPAGPAQANQMRAWEREKVDRAREGAAWLDEVVWGGVEGKAYARSLSEFVAGASRGYGAEEEEVETTETAEEAMVPKVEETELAEPEVQVKLEEGAASLLPAIPLAPAPAGPSTLPTSLATYVARTRMDPLTSSLHSILRSIRPTTTTTSTPSSSTPTLATPSPDLAPLLAYHLHTLPAHQRRAWLASPKCKMDLAPLLKQATDLLLPAPPAQSTPEDVVPQLRALLERGKSGGEGEDESEEEKKLRLALLGMAKLAPLEHIVPLTDLKVPLPESVRRAIAGQNQK